MPARAFDQQLFCRRSLVGGVLSTLAVAGLAGCTGLDAAEGSASAAVDEAEAESLRVALRAPSCIDPYNCQTEADVQVVWQLFDSLTAYDFASGQLTGLAAESWEVSDDACEFTFHLVPGATFHNGDPVDAAAFKRAWERIVNPQSAVAELNGPSSLGYLLALVDGYDELVAGSADELAGLTCPDDETLVVALSQPYADFAFVAAHPALGPVPALADSDAASFYAAPVGNGPFSLAEGTAWEPGQDVGLVRFDAYCGTPAAVEAVELLGTAGASEAYRSLQSEDVDVADVPLGELSGAKKEFGVSLDGCTMAEDERLVIGTEPALLYLACNVGRAPLDSADARRALSLAIDRGTICKSVYKNTRTAADDVIPPGVPGYREGAWVYCTHDAEQADELLQAEYPATDDEPREVPVTLVYNENGGHDEVVDFIVDDLAEVGVVVESEPLDWDLLLEACASGEFDLALLSWTPDFPIMDNVLYPLLHSDCAGGSNRSGYASDEVDAAIGEARSLVDFDARIACLQEADDRAADDVPVIPILYYGHVLAGSDRISSLYCDPLGRLDLAGAGLV